MNDSNLDTSVASPELFFLASLLTSYPDERCIHHIRVMLESGEIDPLLEFNQTVHWNGLKLQLQHKMQNAEALDELRSDYIDLFDRGQAANPLYETEYGRDRAMRKTAELADLAGFYRAFGLDVDGASQHDMLDHVAVELEFYSLLLVKEILLDEAANSEGCEIVRSARKSFLADHLGRFVGSIGERPDVQTHPFYSTVFKYCQDLIVRECATLDVEPDRIAWISSESEPEAVCCGNFANTMP